MAPMTVGSLFSGIGGFDLGLERAGMTVRWQVENDPYCNRVLRKHWPDVVRYGDITLIDWHTVERVDLVCGGFPCQPVSVAGKRKGRDDARWLWPEFVRCLGVLRPRYVLVENVPGLLSGPMGEVLRDLADLRYDAEWQMLSAAAIGAPHLRKRIFIAGQTVADTRKPRQTIFQGCSTYGIVDGYERLGGNGSQNRTDTQWSIEPDVGRVAHGVPHRVDRLRGLGNAVVPQVVEWIGMRIMAKAKEA